MINIKQVYKQNIGFRIVFILIAAALATYVFVVSPDVKFPVMLYKLCLVTVSAVVGYFIDFILFPNYRPSDLADEISCTTDKHHLAGLYSLAGQVNIRRAIIIGVAVLCTCIGI